MKQSELQVNSLGYRWSFEGGGGHYSVGCWKAGSKRLAVHSSNSSMTAVCSSISTLDSSASCPAAPPKSTASTDRNICNKTGQWPALFLTFPLHLWWSLHYFTLLYSLLCGCGHTLLYVRLTLHYPILDCGHTLSLRRCGNCLICVFLILYLYNVVGGDCGPHFVFTP